MIPRFTMRQALEDEELLGASLSGSSWEGWRALLIAAMGERLLPPERKLFRQFTGRTKEPLQRIEEAAFIVGRRGGKDRAASTLATYIAGLCDHTDKLAPGERGVVVCIAPDKEQAKITLDYAEAAFEATPILKQLIDKRTQNALELTNRISIEVRASSFRRIRGVTAVAVIASEAAFWMDNETSANPDTEILNAVRPALATTGGPLILISSPYAQRGELWSIYKQHFGPDGDPLILVAQGASNELNPTLPQKVIDRAMKRDPEAARAEYGAQFRTDIASFVERAAVEACVESGVRERERKGGYQYFGFVDPSGGRADSFTLAIGHRESRTPIVDVLREFKPPFSPDQVVTECAGLLKSYHVKRISGDRYAGLWPVEAFAKHNIKFEQAAKAKSDLYLDLLPLLNSGRARLLDSQRLVNQLCGLERQVARSGRESIDHSPGAHDDVANAVAGLMSMLVRKGGYDSSMVWVDDSYKQPDDSNDRRAPYFDRYAATMQGRMW